MDVDRGARSSSLIREVSLTGEIIRASGRVELPHRDPEDRFLAATAAALGLCLVISDAKLLSGRAYRVLENK